MIVFFAGKTNFSAALSPIIPQSTESTPCIWGLNRRLEDFSKLNNLITHHHLTETLEMLEQSGFWGESGLSVIAFLQEEGA